MRIIRNTKYEIPARRCYLPEVATPLQAGASSVAGGRNTKMSKTRFYIFAFTVATIVVGLFWGSSKAQDTLPQESFILNRAVELASFKEDEKPVVPEIKYILPGDRSVPTASIDGTTRIVTILNPKYTFGGIVAVFVAPQYGVIDAGRVSTLSSFKRVVGDVLKDNGVEIAKEDIVSPDLSTEVRTNLKINITRVSVAEVQNFEIVPYQTKNIDDNTIDKGKTKVSQAGIVGQKTLTYRVRRENGVEISRTLINQEITTKATDEIIKVGTKPVISVRCKYNDTVLSASIKYHQDPNALCNLMMKESNGNTGSIGEGPDGTKYLGLFQYDEGFWPSASSKAGFSGASWQDATAQINTTAYLFSIGQGGRW